VLERNARLASARDEQPPVDGTRQALAGVHGPLRHSTVAADHDAQRDSEHGDGLHGHGFAPQLLTDGSSKALIV
jgi:hypothetical protein